MQGDVLPPSHPHAQLQAFEAIQTTDAFPIHQPTLPSQQYPDPLRTEAWPGVCQLSDAQP